MKAKWIARNLMVLVLLGPQVVVSCSTNAPDAELRVAIEKYYSAWVRGNVHEQIAMYDPRSWQFVAKDAYLSQLQVEMDAISKDLRTWNIETIRVSGDAAHVQTVLLKHGSEVLEGTTWVMRDRRWWITLDAWDSRNRDPRIWQSRSTVVDLNKSCVEPKGKWRDQVAAQTKRAIQALEAEDCGKLIALMTPAIRLNGGMSWHVEESMEKLCSSHWMPRKSVGLIVHPPEDFEVSWRCDSIRLPPLGGDEGYPSVALSCWEVFIPIASDGQSSSDEKGMLLQWVRTPKGVRIGDISFIGFRPVN